MSTQRDTDARGDAGSRSGIDFYALALGALGAVVAAIVTTTFWPPGAPITAALTSVIISLTKEGLRKPAEKVTAQASRVTVAPVRGAAALAAAGARSRRGDTADTRQQPVEEGVNGRSNGAAAGPIVGPPPPLAPPPPVDDTRSYDPTRSFGESDPAGEVADAEEADTAPGAAEGAPTERRVYGRKRFRLKVALLTGLAAFGIAVAALTIPELVFGGSVAGDRGTTLFGGESRGDGSDGGDGSGGDQDAQGQDPQPTDDPAAPTPAPEDQQQQSRPQEPAPDQRVEPEEPVEPEAPSTPPSGSPQQQQAPSGSSNTR